MVHKPKYKVHSFRGLLGNGGEDEINLERQNANLAYRIVRFELMANAPTASDNEAVVKIYRESQSSIDATVDFTQTDLIAAGYWRQADNPAYPINTQTIIDPLLFSRNIFVTHSQGSGSSSCNYFIEIEEVPVGAATLMQLKLGTARRLISAKMGGS